MKILNKILSWLERVTGYYFDFRDLSFHRTE